jgi:nicotinate-nucleotide adenylyltransferase
VEKTFGNQLFKIERLFSVTFEFIYGGSFDPLHKGHVNLVKEVINHVKALAERSINDIAFRFLPCATPALKKRSTNSFSNRCDKLNEVFTSFFLEQEIDMLVDKREGVRTTAGENKSYTIDSLEELKSENDSIIRFLIIGADNFNRLKRWKNYQEIKNYCNLLVVNRAKESLEHWVSLAECYGFNAKLKNNELLKKQKLGCCYYLQIPEVDISSTEIREKIKANHSVEDWLA